jgi:plasmid maintenance system antidote protein VapI
MASAGFRLRRRCGSRYFGTSALFWLNLETACELAVAEQAHGKRIAEEVAPAA